MSVPGKPEHRVCPQVHRGRVAGAGGGARSGRGARGVAVVAGRDPISVFHGLLLFCPFSIGDSPIWGRFCLKCINILKCKLTINVPDFNT